MSDSIEQSEHLEPPASQPTPPSVAPIGMHSDTEAYIIWGFVLGVLSSFYCCCSPVSIAAIVLGLIAYSKGDRRGIWVVVVGVACGVASLAIHHFGVGLFNIFGLHHRLPLMRPPVPGRWT